MARRRSGPEILAQAGDLLVQRDADRPSGRLLRQGDMDASYVDLSDPRHLVTIEALTDAARVVAPGGALAINVVDAPPMADVRAIGAGLQEVFPTVAALGGGPVLRARRQGNVVLVAAHGPLPLERLRVRAAADGASPAALAAPHEVQLLCRGTPPWQD